MIKLYQFVGNQRTHNYSPFCLKAETYLRMAAIPYERVTVNNPAVGPKGKLPFIEHDGKRIPDSAFIVDYLKQTFGDRLDAGLSAVESAQAVAVTRMLESDLYWALLYSRWIDEPGWSLVRAEFFKGLPFLSRQLIPALVHRKMQRTLHLQGMGRHNRDEVYHIGCADITALSVMLGKKAYLFGDQPTSVDASAFGFLHNILHDGMGTPLTKRAESYANLVKYCERINAKYFTASADAAPGRERKSKPRRAAAR